MVRFSEKYDDIIWWLYYIMMYYYDDIWLIYDWYDVIYAAISDDAVSFI